MNLMKMVRSAALAAMLLSASVANAALLQFTVTGDYSASWQMDANPSPDVYGADAGFLFYDFDFPDAYFGVADITFWSASNGGGLEIDDYYGESVLLSTEGPQLYSGTEDNPFFLLGTFALSEFLGSGSYTLTIAQLDSPPPAGVPEPATGALLAGGLFLIFARRKRTRV